jgi:hypothetical protein
MFFENNSASRFKKERSGRPPHSNTKSTHKSGIPSFVPIHTASASKQLARVFEVFIQTLAMKEKIYNPAGTNKTSPAEGMAAVNTFNPEEMEDKARGSLPKNFETDESREQEDDTHPIEKHRDE